MKMLTYLIIGLVAAASVRAEVPMSLNYQGRLLDAGGQPVNATVPVAVAVFSAETGGTQVFTQHVGNVTVQNGIYSFAWGDVTLGNTLTNAECWLQVHVNGATLAPRQRLVSVPYAIQSSTALVAEEAGDADTVDGLQGSVLRTPAGVILPYGGAAPPAGYLICDGVAVSRATYADLFAAIGTAFGGGDGATTFNVPDLRGTFLRGRDGGSGRDPDAASRVASQPGGNTGDAIGSAQDDQLRSHRHNRSLACVGSVACGGGGDIPPRAQPTSYDNVTFFTEYAGGSETRPRNVSVNFIIKF